jgi:hypothetical protein
MASSVGAASSLAGAVVSDFMRDSLGSLRFSSDTIASSGRRWSARTPLHSTAALQGGLNDDSWPTQGRIPKSNSVTDEGDGVPQSNGVPDEGAEGCRSSGVPHGVEPLGHLTRVAVPLTNNVVQPKESTVEHTGHSSAILECPAATKLHLKDLQAEDGGRDSPNISAHPGAETPAGAPMASLPTGSANAPPVPRFGEEVIAQGNEEEGGGEPLATQAHLVRSFDDVPLPKPKSTMLSKLDDNAWPGGQPPVGDPLAASTAAGTIASSKVVPRTAQKYSTCSQPDPSSIYANTNSPPHEAQEQLKAALAPARTHSSLHSDGGMCNPLAPAVAPSTTFRTAPTLSFSLADADGKPPSLDVPARELSPSRRASPKVACCGPPAASAAVEKAPPASSTATGPPEAAYCSSPVVSPFTVRPLTAVSACKAQRSAADGATSIRLTDSYARSMYDVLKSEDGGAPGASGAWLDDAAFAELEAAAQGQQGMPLA